jgi:hypothetical protein
MESRPTAHFPPVNSVNAHISSFGILPSFSVILAQAPQNKKPTVGFSARFFPVVSSTLSWGYVVF